MNLAASATGASVTTRRVGGFHDHSREFCIIIIRSGRGPRARTALSFPRRRMRPVVYYLNPNFPDDLKETAIKIGHGRAMCSARVTSATGKLWTRSASRRTRQVCSSSMATNAVRVPCSRCASCSIKGLGISQREPSMNLVALEAADGL